MTRAAIARQILYYRQLRFDRPRILYEIKRKVGKRWNKGLIAFIDQVIANRGMPRSDSSEEARTAVVAALSKKLGAEKKGKRWLRVERAAQLGVLERRKKSLGDALVKSGFARAGVRGDVGMWCDCFVFRKQRGLELYANLTLYERRKPYRLELELEFG